MKFLRALVAIFLTVIVSALVAIVFPNGIFQAKEALEITVEETKIPLDFPSFTETISIEGFPPILSSGEETSTTLDTTEIVETTVPETEPQIVLDYYSDTIKVLVTEEQKAQIKKEVASLKKEIKMLAKLIYREAGGIKSDMHKAAVVWCVLNRVDEGGYYGDSIKSVITKPNQFCWISNTPIKEELVDLATDVLTRWLLEKEGFTNVGRVLPKEYCFFYGDGKINHFRDAYRGGNKWKWTLENPYDAEK